MRPLILSLCCLALVAGSWPAAAQDFVPTPVEISGDKVNIGGRIFYMHKVLKGQTLYSISKAYGVSVESIQQANPSLSDGLKAGAILYIPQMSSPETAAGPEVPAGAEGSNLSPQEQVTETPQPAAKDRKQQDRKKKYKKYNVKWYESLDDVAVKFNVTVEALVSLNGIDTDSDKRIRSVLIPDDAYMKSMGEIEADNAGSPLQSGIQTDTAAETVTGELPDAVTERPSVPVSPTAATEKQDYTISIVLPFNASRLTDGLNAYTADFYAGVLTAAASLKEQSLMDGITIRAVDLSRYSSSWEMLSDGALEGSSLIIGPISERDLQPVAAYGLRNRIPTVSPLDLKTAGLAENNPYFYLFPPKSDLALSHQIDKIAVRAADTSSVSVTVIYEQGYEFSDAVVETVTALQERDIPYRTFHYDFLSGRGIDSVMVKSLRPSVTNCVLVPSMSEAFITDALRNLNLIESAYDYNVEVYGLSKWKSFETIETHYFHSLDLRLAMSYHIDYGDTLTADFIARYRAAFNTEPTSFAYQGHDILTFFVNAINTYGNRFPEAIINERKSLIQSDVLFLPTAPGSGYENRAFKDILFTEGWTVLSE